VVVGTIRSCYRPRLSEWVQRRLGDIIECRGWWSLCRCYVSHVPTARDAKPASCRSRSSIYSISYATGQQQGTDWSWVRILYMVMVTRHCHLYSTFRCQIQVVVYITWFQFL